MSSLLHRRIRRPSAALLVAFAALFTALGGTGYAALLITGANVANGSLTGLDIENKSLGGKEMKSDTLEGQPDQGVLARHRPERRARGDRGHRHERHERGQGRRRRHARRHRLRRADDRSSRACSRRTVGTNDNFGNNATLGTLADLAGGQYLVTAKLTYDNDGAFEQETCTLHVPGSDDTSTFQVGAGETETLHLQEAVSSGSMWAASVSCTADPNDDMIGPLSIIAVRRGLIPLPRAGRPRPARRYGPRRDRAHPDDLRVGRRRAGAAALARRVLRPRRARRPARRRVRRQRQRGAPSLGDRVVVGGDGRPRALHRRARRIRAHAPQARRPRDHGRSSDCASSRS